MDFLASPRGGADRDLALRTEGGIDLFTGGGGGGGGAAYTTGTDTTTTAAVDAGQDGNGMVTLTYEEDPGCAPVPPPTEPPTIPPAADPADAVAAAPAFTG